MSSTRELRHHIRSVKSTQKITRAMEMVAAAKLRHATDAATQARPYTERITTALRDALILEPGEAHHPLLARRTVTNLLVVVMSSDRGLAGAYNTNVVKHAEKHILAARENGQQVSCITFGRKAQAAMRRLDVPVIESYEHAMSHPSVSDALPLAYTITERYATREFDQVDVIYTEFVSAFTLKPTTTPLLPLNITSPTAAAPVQRQMIYEPDWSALISTLIPRYIETRLFHSLQEAVASEHAARRMAMHNATDNAKELISHLQLTYNTVRQNSITRELTELAAGAVS